MHAMEEVPTLHLNGIMFDAKQFKGLNATQIEAW